MQLNTERSQLEYETTHSTWGQKARVKWTQPYIKHINIT